MSKSTFSVPGMHCGNCKASVEGAVRALDGVSNVVVDLGSKVVDVEFDENKLAIGEIVNAIEDQGYDVAVS